jgi:hypothetical protein
MQQKPTKAGTKKHGYGKVKTWHFSKKAKPQPRPPSWRSGAGHECLILTPSMPCPSIPKRHTNSVASAAHVLHKLEKITAVLFSPAVMRYYKLIEITAQKPRHPTHYKALHFPVAVKHRGSVE